MSVRSIQPPQLSNTPTMPLAEARAKNLNVAKVATCGVPEIGPDNVYRVRACNKGIHCAREGFGTARLGAFGPRSDEPGTGGQGPEMVPYYHFDVGSSTEVEGQMPCFIWMQTMMDKYESQRKTGDVLEVLGRQGETSITVLETLPSDGNGNKPGSATHMVPTPRVVKVLPFKAGDGRSSRMDYALKMREQRDRIEGAANRERMAPGPEPEEQAEQEELPATAEVETGGLGATEPEEQEAEGVLGDIAATPIPADLRKTTAPRFGRGSRS